METTGGFFSTKKLPIVLTMVILMVGSIIYFSLGEINIGMNNKIVSADIFKEIQLKAAYTPDKQLKIFALAKNNQLIEYKVSEGKSLPESGTVVIGSEEAKMMQSEKLFSKVGDEIKDLFGVDLKVEGILEKTQSPIDEFHFVSEKTFSFIEGEDNRVFIKINEENVPKMFYALPINVTSPVKFELKEGNFKDYQQIREISDEKYYPLLIGSEEAKMMQSEKLFSKPGDIIRNLFGKNFLVVGVLSHTNTSLDMIHIVPLSEKDFEEVQNE